MKFTNKEELKRKIVESMAVTNNQSQTARELDVNRSTVSRWANKDDVRKAIEEEQQKFFESLPNARKNIQGLIDNFDTLESAGDRDKAWKSSMEMLRASGMLPTNTPSVFVQNVYNQTNTVILNDMMKGLLDQQQQAIDNAIEAEFEDIEDE